MKSFDLTLRSVSPAINGEFTAESAPTRVTFPGAPTSKPSTTSGLATGSTAAAPVAAAPAMPTSTVSGTSNGAGSGANGALAASTGDPGIDAPCTAKNGTLYPTLYSTVGSQLTMIPNVTGMGEPTSFTVVAGALPPGIQLERFLGVVFGVPTQAGSWTTTVRATFEDGSTKDGQFGTRVDADPQTLQYAPLTVGTVGSPIAVAPSTNAPASGTTYRLVCGSLPAGTTLDPRTGQITGTPTSQSSSDVVALRVAEKSASGAAAASFIFVALNDEGQQATQRMNYPSHPHVRIGKPVRIRPSIIGVDDMAKYRTSKGKLPKGLRLNKATGEITGRVMKPGKAHTVTIVAQTTSGRLLTSTPMRITITRGR